jgi:hypothetical protein
VAAGEPAALEGREERGIGMRTLRCAVLAAGLLVACASSGVQLQSPQSSFPTAQKVLLAIAKEHGYTVGYPVQKLPQAGQRPNRALLRVTMPDAGGGEALVYTVEANDIYGHLLVWAADAERAGRLCAALGAAGVPFEVKRGAGQALECGGP